MKKFLLPTVLFITSLAVTACQSPKPATPPHRVDTQAQSPVFVPNFHITGKLGIITHTPQGKQAVSAFYAWVQEGERFGIDLTGALGVGATKISYDGQTASLTSDSAKLTAQNPNELLTKATGWHAPIDKLPYWIMGKAAAGDVATFDNHRLTQSQNGDWTAVFEYATAATPKRIVITHTDGHKVTLTINHATTN